MRIILQKRNDRYGFIMATNRNKFVYSSFNHYFLTPHVKSSYKYAWEACKDAWKLALKRPYHIRVALEDMEDPVDVEVSAENMLVDHYVNILRDVRRRAKGSIGADEEEKENIYKEIQMIVEELNSVLEQITDLKDKSQLKSIIVQYKKLIRKYFKKEDDKRIEEMAKSMEAEKASLQSTDISGEAMPVPPPSPMGVTASCVESKLEKDFMSPEIIGELADEYGQRICRSIQEKHKDAYYAYSPNNKEITIYDFSNSPLLKISMNDNLNINNVVPVGKLHELYPFGSVSFYQKYWKPIVEGVGHFSIGDPSILVMAKNGTLPDVNGSAETHIINGWNCEKKEMENVAISFKGEKPIWIIEPYLNAVTAQVKHPSKYTEQDYVNAIVRCIDPKLKSIYSRTGAVIQIIPNEDLIEIDVDFGEGLGNVRLTEQQIEIVPIGE